MSTLVGIGNKYNTLEDAIKNGIRDIIVSSNMHVKNTLLLSYGKYNITISNSCLIYLDMDDYAFSGKEFTSILIMGGSVELRSKNLCPNNISMIMKNVSLSCNGCDLSNITLVDSIVSGNINVVDSNISNVTMEGELTCNGGQNNIKDSRLREDINIISGKVVMDNCHIKNISTMDGQVVIYNSEITNWICPNRGTKLSLILQHNIISSNVLPSIDNSLIIYNTFKSDVIMLYSYNSNIGYNIGSSLTIEFLRNSIVEHNNISMLNISHESSSSSIRNNICDSGISVMTSKSNKISYNLCTNLNLPTLDKCKIKGNNVKNITIKYLLQSSISYHTEINMLIACSIDSKVHCNTCCDVNIGTLTRSYYISNYIDASDVVTISNPTMSTITGNKSYEGDMGHIHIVAGSDNIIQDNCNISII